MTPLEQIENVLALYEAALDQVGSEHEAMARMHIRRYTARFIYGVLDYELANKGDSRYVMFHRDDIEKRLRGGRGEVVANAMYRAGENPLITAEELRELFELCDETLAEMEAEDA